ncbi:Inositol-pentakisphosphate 2-kinase [Linum perenne]
MDLKLEKKDADDWIYRGEGAANLVLAYSGSSPAFVNFIDLDMKPLKNIEDYYELDQKILKCYSQMVGGDPRKGNPASTGTYGVVN